MPTASLPINTSLFQVILIELDCHMRLRDLYWIADGEKLLLPTESSYVFNDSQKVLLPCRPTHPDVFVSLQKPALTGRGMENIVRIFIYM